MAEISFRRGYDVEPAPAKDVVTCQFCGHTNFWADDLTCQRCNPRCDRIACANAPAHPPHLVSDLRAAHGVATPAPPAITYGMLVKTTGGQTVDCGDGSRCVPPHPLGNRFEKTCPLCSFVSERIGSAPTFCASCDSPFELKKEPAVHCAICNLQAPFVVGRSLTSNAFHGKALVPDTDGWSRSFFPWPDKKWRSGEGAAWPESTWLCPKDAAEVAKFIAHRREPMRTEYENL